MAKSNFIVRGGADFSGITRELNKIQGQLKGFSNNINKVFSGMGINIGKFTKFALIGMATRELYKFGKASIEVASDLREVQNVVDVTFGSMSNQVNEFASNATKQFGLSELSAKKFTSTMGAMLKSSGLTGQAVTDMSIEVAKLTADMASFYNLSGDEAFTKIRSGLSGETEPLKQLGINMSVANMEAYAMSKGISKAWREMTQAEQTMLRYNYLLSVTGDAQGDFARNSGSWANQIKLLKEQWQEFMGLIGTALIEVLLPVVKGLNKLLEILISVTKEIGKIYTMITGKQVKVQSTAVDAAKGEEELADGISEAANAAKKALAPFDELNVLQSNLSGGSTSNLAGAVDSGGGLNTVMSTTKVDDGLKFKIDDEEPKKFFIWFENKMKWLKETLLIPIRVPAPIFASIPNPIYRPNWGLTPPVVPAPAFEPVIAPGIDEREFETSKGKYLNPVPAPSFEPVIVPAIDAETDFNPSLENTKKNYGIALEYISSITRPALLPVSIAFATLFSGLSKNTAEWGNNTATNYQRALNYIPTTTALALGSAALAFNGFLTGTDTNTVTWGDSIVKNFGKIGEGIYANFVTPLIAAYNQWAAFKEATGEKISNWWSGNKHWVAPALVGGLAAAAIGGIVISGGSLAPAMGALTPALAAIPGLATGAVIPPNSEFLAILGDQKSGVNIETPEKLLRQIVREEIDNLPQPEINIIASGDEGGLIRYMKFEIDKETKRLGRNLVEGSTL